MNIRFLKGQITPTIAIAGTIVTALVSLGTAYMTSDAKVAVIEEREQNHYNEVQKTLGRIEEKLDKLK